jgi:hypothetical protein
MRIIAGPEGSGRSAYVLAQAIGALREDPKLVVLHYSLTLDTREQIVRLLAMESGVPANRIRWRDLDPAQCRACDEADFRLRTEVRPRLFLFAAAGSEPPDADRVAGRPFDPMVVLGHRAQVMQSTGATSFLIVVDDFASIGIARDSIAGPSDGYIDDYRFDPQRLGRLVWLRRMTASPERPGTGRPARRSG